ncbi:hypothetical protein PBRA_002595 [Plasmodiophora brassicae]|uniref:Uncharacterized protein n=1 Tax=Plasmodiophora brassicae TaxID=37360 RepID=A0A0G4J4W3_PLABS|nr:hypothetical protein PBRA_002595 [Plasmodiophora brassicae]
MEATRVPDHVAVVRHAARRRRHRPDLVLSGGDERAGAAALDHRPVRRVLLPELSFTGADPAVGGPQPRLLRGRPCDPHPGQRRATAERHSPPDIGRAFVDTREGLSRSCPVAHRVSRWAPRRRSPAVRSRRQPERRGPDRGDRPGSRAGVRQRQRRQPRQEGGWHSASPSPTNTPGNDDAGGLRRRSSYLNGEAGGQIHTWLGVSGTRSRWL